jgi:hypothetical protein
LNPKKSSLKKARRKTSASTKRIQKYTPKAASSSPALAMTLSTELRNSPKKILLALTTT